VGEMNGYQALLAPRTPTGPSGTVCSHRIDNGPGLPHNPNHDRNAIHVHTRSHRLPFASWHPARDEEEIHRTWI
jgi:hypothetical protein